MDIGSHEDNRARTLDTKPHLLKLAAYLRAREANALRGQPEQLQELEHITNLSLLTKWVWLVAIVAALGSFAAAPFLLIVLKPLLPAILRDILWFIARVAMTISMVIFAGAIFLTFKPPVDL